MASDHNEVVKDVYPFFRLYKDGRVERFYSGLNETYAPPFPQDPITGVSSKDVTISPHVSARLYLPKATSVDQKWPILVYYHGGGLCAGSAFLYGDHRFLNSLVSESKAIAVSVDYRLVPEVNLMTLYDDCWSALQWVASHAGKDMVNTDSWLTNHGDFERVFLAGDSAGGNIVFNMSMRAGRESLDRDVKILGSIILCPYFLIPLENTEQGIPYKIWINIAPPSECGIHSPMINPLAEKAPSLAGLVCSKLLVCIGEKDDLIPREIGIRFAEGVKQSGWKGELEFIEYEGGGHSFQIVNPETENAKDLIKRVATFMTHR